MSKGCPYMSFRAYETVMIVDPKVSKNPSLWGMCMLGKDMGALGLGKDGHEVTTPGGTNVKWLKQKVCEQNGYEGADASEGQERKRNAEAREWTGKGRKGW
jgi:hypothetical protein